MSVNMKQNGNLTPVASLTKAIIPLGVADCYSTEERQVGCWTDGKPLYQKTFTYHKTNIAANSNFDITSDLNGIDNVVAYQSRIKYMIDASIKGEYYSDDLVRLAKDSANAYRIYLTIGQATLATADIDLTVLYTKTTDTAGSGIWTPNGATAVHYSTSEQVVGTWIDGKPLYEKTIYIQNPTAGGYYAHGVENIKRIIIHEVTGLRNGQWNCGIFNTNSGDRLTVLAYPTSGNSGLYTDFSMSSLKDLYVVLRYTKTTD